MKQPAKIILWTDGSAIPNPGRGGFAVIEEHPDGGTPLPVVLGSAPNTTNIRMEASALIAAIKYAGSTPCEIHTDSEFWVNVITKWAPSWKRNGWRKKTGTGEIKNLDLVQELYELYETHDVELIWTRGHVGTALNELADHWADEARAGVTLP